MSFSFFFFNDTATTEIYTLSLHDALPISTPEPRRQEPAQVHLPLETTLVVERTVKVVLLVETHPGADRKSTRLNSSHSQISYAVFCLKKKKKNKRTQAIPRVTLRRLPPPQ